MDVSVTIPDDVVVSFRAECRRRLDNQFPTVTEERAGPDDAEGNPTTIEVEIDDPTEDPILVWLDDLINDEVCARRITAATQAKDDATTQAERRDALMAEDDARQAKIDMTKQRRSRDKRNR